MGIFSRILDVADVLRYAVFGDQFRLNKEQFTEVRQYLNSSGGSFTLMFNEEDIRYTFPRGVAELDRENKKLYLRGKIPAQIRGELERLAGAH